ncbi:biotin--[acetyl-CoA-carboxylase] ligase [Corynebacterium lubricantis]|uniref:biotin--[acetyl-CoA-carboxylase] ligase n=1 Tax=Corynebacterium lubricantis TaxID=541095 RepID=UPI00036625DF|nr:biotin--[acetyl-CoA-carboxylase] ligase [Corynebacterium lubricantis]
MTLIDIDAVRARVTEWWPTVTYIDSVGSTNTAQLSSGTPGSALIAGEQTAGKGRLGRAWQSPKGTQLSLSVLIDDPLAADIGLIPLTVGVAVTDVIPEARLKWPNDVLLNGKKLAGILSEADFSGDAPRVVVGIGLNVALTAEQLPVEHATSLKLAGIDFDWTDLAADLLAAMGRRLAQWRAGDPALLKDYRAVCSSIGQEVKLMTPAGDIFGTVDGVNDHGEIVVNSVAYSAGDVTHLRPR